jgi:hypothetical protein
MRAREDADVEAAATTAGTGASRFIRALPD